MKSKAMMVLSTILLTGSLHADTGLTRYEVIFDNNSSQTVTMTIDSTDHISQSMNPGTQYRVPTGQPVRLVFYVDHQKVGHVHFSLDGTASCSIRAVSYYRDHQYDLQFRECVGALSRFSGTSIHSNYFYANFF